MKNYLLYRKETENKFRWDTFIGDAPFELYVPQWRVPDPIPDVIDVTILIPPDLPAVTVALTPQLALSNPILREQPILARLQRYSDHTKTVRYDPVGDKKLWEIGSLYIPIAILPDVHVDDLVIQVRWERRQIIT